MEWTTEKPTKPGWYWNRDKNGISVLRVYKYGRFLRVSFDPYGTLLVRDLEGKWAGPIDPPTERTEGK